MCCGSHMKILRFERHLICGTQLLNSSWVPKRTNFCFRPSDNRKGPSVLCKLDVFLQARGQVRPHQRLGELLVTTFHKNLSICACHTSRYRRPLDVPNLLKAEEAQTFVRSLKENERKNLLQELHKLDVEKNANSNGDLNGGITVTRNQLKALFFINCMPFIGFGFLDNAIMILAGDYVDHTIGVALGISTMAAAAVGNLVSDVAGIGLAGYVELLCTKLGQPVPDLTPDQLDLNKSRIYANLGKAVGIIIGCLLGMFPLLFLGEEREECD